MQPASAAYRSGSFAAIMFETWYRFSITFLRNRAASSSFCCRSCSSLILFTSFNKSCSTLGSVCFDFVFILAPDVFRVFILPSMTGNPSLSSCLTPGIILSASIETSFSHRRSRTSNLGNKDISLDRYCCSVSGKGFPNISEHHVRLQTFSTY